MMQLYDWHNGKLVKTNEEYHKMIEREMWRKDRMGRWIACGFVGLMVSFIVFVVIDAIVCQCY